MRQALDLSLEYSFVSLYVFEGNIFQALKKGIWALEDVSSCTSVCRR